MRPDDPELYPPPNTPPLNYPPPKRSTWPRGQALYTLIVFWAIASAMIWGPYANRIVTDRTIGAALIALNALLAYDRTQR